MAQRDNLLIDNFGFEPKTILSEDKGNGRMVIRGEFARADVATENKRIYPKSLWERELKRLKPAMESRKVYGMPEHPADGRTSLTGSSHLLTKLWMEGDVVMGEAEVINTHAGKDLKAILEAAGKIGVSSRGFGTTRPNQEGKDVVQDDYRLATFDAVADPANTTSYPTVHTEDKSVDTDEVKTETKIAGKRLPVSEALMSDKMTLAKLKESNPALYEHFMDDAQREFEKKGAQIWAAKIMAAREAGKETASTDLKTTFAENLKAAIEAAKAEVAEQEREKLANDPTVAGAKQALEAVKALLRPYIVPEDVEAVVAQKDQEVSNLNAKMAEIELENANLRSENVKLAEVAKEAGYKYHLESMLHGVPQAGSIRKMVGDVKLYENLDTLNKKISDVVDEMTKDETKRQERDLEMEKVLKENRALREAAEKSLEASKLFAVMTYAEERLRHHPKAELARTLIESKSPDTKEGVDKILAQFREKKTDQRTLEEARARVRDMLGSSTREYISEREERPSKAAGSLVENQTIHGQPVDQLRILAGIEEN